MIGQFMLHGKTNIFLTLTLFFQITSCGFFMRKKITPTKQDKNLLQALLSNPLTVLMCSKAVNHQFWDEAKKIKDEIKQNSNNPQEYVDRFRFLVRTYELHKNPIFLLTECQMCTFLRSTENNNVSLFENIVSDALTDMIRVYNQVEYTSFGSSGGFRDLVILAKTLTNNPYAHITMNLINVKNYEFVTLHDIIFETKFDNKNTNQPVTKELVIYKEKVGRDPEYLERLKKPKSPLDDPRIITDKVIYTTFTPEVINTLKPRIKMQKTDATDSEVDGILQSCCTTTEAESRQFIASLKRMFPHSQLTLKVHGTCDKYRKYIEQRKLPYPDVLVAVDIEPVFGSDDPSVPDYVKLCAKTLREKNGAMHNFWLTNNYGIQSFPYTAVTALEHSLTSQGILL